MSTLEQRYGEMEDVPANIHSLQTSSIGEVAWPPVKASHERFKGIVPIVLDTPAQLEWAMNDFTGVPFGHDASRISARAVVNTELLNDLRTDYSHLVETIFPLERCGLDALRDCVWVYFGKNDRSRTTPNDLLRAQHKHLVSILHETAIVRRLSVAGFTTRLLRMEERENSGIQKMFFDLYSVFGWDEDAIVEMLKSPNTLLFGVSDNDTKRIVSTVQVERGSVLLIRDGKEVTLTLAEITEAATLPEYRGQQLYGVVSDAALMELACHDTPHITFGEINLDAKGALKTAARQGRTFALETSQQYRFPKAWYLDEHALIAWPEGKDRPEGYPFNNLAGAFLPQEVLQTFASSIYEKERRRISTTS